MIRLASSLRLMVVSMLLNHYKCWFFMYCSMDEVVSL